MDGLRSFAGEGTLYAQELDSDGNLIGAKAELMNCIALSTTGNVELIKVISNRLGTAGNVLDSRDDKQGMDATIKGNTFNQAVLEMIFFGTATANDGATVTDEPINAGDLDEWVDIGYPGATLDELADAATGLVIYVVDVDYEYNERLGWVKPLSTGSITAAEDLFADITKPSTGYSIPLNTEGLKRVRLWLDGKNKFNQQDCTLILWSVAMTSDSEFDFLSTDDTQEGSFTASLEVPDGKTDVGELYYTD